MSMSDRCEALFYVDPSSSIDEVMDFDGNVPEPGLLICIRPRGHEDVHRHASADGEDIRWGF